jgi:hypothetical protein
MVVVMISPLYCAAASAACGSTKRKGLAQLRRRNLPFDLTALEHETAIGLPFPLSEKVGRHENRPPLGCLVAEPMLQHAAPVRVEAQPRFVEHQDVGVGKVEDREPEALTRATRQTPGDDPQELTETPTCDHGVDPLRGQAAQLRVERKDLCHRQSGVETRRLRQERQAGLRRGRFGGNVVAVHKDATAIGGREAGKQAERRGLSTAVGADEQRELARAHRERQIVWLPLEFGIGPRICRVLKSRRSTRATRLFALSFTNSQRPSYLPSVCERPG